MNKPTDHSRRSFLKVSAAATGGLLVAGAWRSPLEALAANAEPAAASVFNPLLKIGVDNTIYVTVSKVEIGQGIGTTLPMLIAEELDCDYSKIKVDYCPPAKEADLKQHIFVITTGGSDTTRSQFQQYRQAGATARAMLVNAAAQKMGVTPADCSTENGFVIAGNHRLSFGELATVASLLPVPEVTLRKPGQWKYIGRSHKRLDIPEKINGTAKYGIDIQFEGLLTAVVAHAPVFGSTISSFDASKTLATEGVLHVVHIPTGVAVVAKNFWAAKKGRDKLSTTWTESPHGRLDTVSQLIEYRRLSKTNGITTQQKGDITTALRKSDKLLEFEFIVPYLAHAPMETLNCTVKLQPGSCEIWAGTQSPLLHQKEVADFLALKFDQVTFHTPVIGRSFGRKGSLGDDWVMEAVHIAKAINKPVKLVWTREDDIKGGNYRPVYLHRAIITIAPDGFPVAWHHTIVGQSLFTNTLLEKEIVNNGIDYSSIDGVHGSPYLATIPDHKVELVTTGNEVPVLAWRSVGNSHTAFVMEALIDELAEMAAKDPVEYRRHLLKNAPRHLACLNLAAEKAGWTKPLPVGQFRGVAVHQAMGSYVTQIVELSIVNNEIRIHRVVCAIDCGLAVNPTGVEAQMESGIVFGITAALYGEITLEDGQVKQSNFHDYQMLRMNRTPKMEVWIVPSSDKMGGAGEPGVPPVAPAIANALFRATGKRHRRLPLRL